MEKHEHSPHLSITGEPAMITCDKDFNLTKPYAICYKCGVKIILVDGTWEEIE